MNGLHGYGGPCCATFPLTGVHVIDCPEADPDPRALTAIPIPPTLSEVEREEIAQDIRMRENADRVRAQAIRTYARLVAEAWPATYEMIRVLDTRTGDNDGPQAGNHADRVRAARAALLAFTGAVASLNAALEL